MAASPAWPGLSTHKGLDDHAALVVGLADHAALGHGRVFEQRVFHFGAADVVARGDDHVVGAGLVEEVAVGVLQEGVARVVPAVLHVVRLARVVQVAAAGGPDHRQLADGAARHFLAVVVDHLGGVAGHHLADGAAAHVAAGAAEMKMWNISVAPMPSVISMPVASFQSWRVASGRPSPALTQMRSVGTPCCLRKGRHLAVERRRGVADGGADLVDQLAPWLRACRAMSG